MEVRQGGWHPLTPEKGEVCFPLSLQKCWPSTMQCNEVLHLFFFPFSFARAAAGSRPHYVYSNVHYTALCATRVSSETADPLVLLCETDAYMLPPRYSHMARPLQGARLCCKFTTSAHLCFFN